MDIAFLGLGRMGRELVPHLIDAGHIVTVWNRSPGPAETIGRRGARVAGSAAEAVAGADAVVSVLFGPDAVRETLLDADLPWRPGTLWIDVTTVSPDDASEFAGRAASLGIRYVASPVVGSLAPARAGALAVLVGGDHDAVREAKRIVGLWADQEKLRTFDTPAAAAAAKLVANLALAISMEALSEALRFGRAAGLADDDVLATLSLTGIAPFAAMKGPVVVAGEFDDAQFTADALAKDARLMLATADVPLPAVALVAAELQRAIDAGQGGKDFSVIARDR
ncbi:NAD(P)-dependent oxidoreductase [Leifsonia shinshuensis]|uniref:3-hydroxyisobutyrate dehydrogenase n=1 Tax=Leifsonia shinshuensis TaxID=150026 RepID=A0A853CYW4_9MICO|nr:NAD(P)-dependent oxidoreductase [Leifsonia shinshuensis]NYJ24511.1 3-hydroxyisobutyrate dehydrogenase [Leifsonia shinshuensis]